MINKNNIKSLVCLAETKFLSLYDASYENKKGNLKHWIIASRKKNKELYDYYFNRIDDKIDAVIIAAYHKREDALVIVKQYRVPLNDYVYELPAGLIDGNEEIENALKRELHEETGLKVLEVNKKMGRDKVYFSTGMTDESGALVYCICDGEIANDYLEEDEDIEALLVTKKMAEQILKSDAKIDIKALIVLQSFVKLGKKLFE